MEKLINQTSVQAIEGSFSIKKFFVLLNDFRTKIKYTDENSEKMFLEIGQKLYNYLNSSKTITELSSQAASSISERVLKKGVSEISILLEQLEHHFSESISEIEKDKRELSSIFQKIEIIIDEISSFKKIVKHLKVLGISTKIEIARLGTDDKGFSALVQNVDRLSDVIETKALNISAKANFLASEITRTILDLEKLEKEQKKQSTIVLSSALLSLQGFKEQYNGNSIHIENIFNSSKNITKGIGDVVVAIQFHDITRQQMEHVITNIADLKDKIDFDESENEDDSFGMIYDVCELQSVQLNNSISEFGNAVEEIIISLGGIENSVTTIFEETEFLFSGDNKIQGNCLENMRKELLIISEELKKNAKVEQQLNESIKSVVEVVDDLSAFVIEIENIGDEIEIIAINAIIKAAHVGNEGSALGILAEAIQKLSIEAKFETGSITKKLGFVNDATRLLRANLEQSTTDEKSDTITATNQNINLMVNSIINVEGETKKIFAHLKNDILSLRQEIKLTIRSINFHNEIIKTINDVILGLRSIVTELYPLVKHTNKRKMDEHIILNKYTMHSEREIHRKFIAGKNSAKTKLNKTSKSNDNDLGDNVELF
ncbi:MAG: hypothetical protein V1773_02900 [bacterium]